MKIEKLNKDNIKEFIRDMKLNDVENLEHNVDKSELYGVKIEDTFYMGFNSLSFVDTIAILNYSPKLSDELFYECISFLNKSLVVDNYLIIEVYNDRYMKLLEDKYKCKEIKVTLVVNSNASNDLEVSSDKLFMKEKFVDLEMNSIKYNYSKDMVVCNLVKQNIQDEKMILDLHEYFKDSGVNVISFIIYEDSYLYLESLGYKCLFKSYVIRDI